MPENELSISNSVTSGLYQITNFLERETFKISGLPVVYPVQIVPIYYNLRDSANLQRLLFLRMIVFAEASFGDFEMSISYFQF